ncbi:hypothetical protein [Roseicyclus amphidinii]|uniref:hypothetical protein n=1 Tax=Roseicyclus amphidinii TaxID=3034232 RepID=UPI0024E0D246|nr:hypothetical protein [Roseicyclus sp. Amp-Y-6]
MTPAPGLPGDWSTLLRQLGDHLRLLVEAPFLKGDLEAELRLRAMLAAQDMEELHAATDRLAEYVNDRLNALERLQALAEGREPPAPRERFATGDGAAAVARRSIAAGPSGSDFVLDQSRTVELAELARGPLRL